MAKKAKSKDLHKKASSQSPGSNGASGKQKTVNPADGLRTKAVPDDDASINADYYRDGVPGSEATAKQPKTITPFDSADVSAKGKTASIRVFGTRTGKAKQSKDFDLIPMYTKFILGGSSESRQERHQVIQTFSDFYVFFFGEQPPIFSFTGMLINTKNVNWVNDFYFYYENHLRGTKCVEQNARLILSYGGRQIEGYMLGCASQTEAATESGVPFSFQLLVTRRNTVGLSDDFGSFYNSKGILQNDPTLISILKELASKEGTGTSTPETSSAINSAKDAMAGGPAALMSPRTTAQV